jgi:tRNA U34 2-thiouridine synthase MnmA/TrmU
VTVGGAEGLLSSRCVAAEANWLVDEAELSAAADGEGWFPVLAQHRYNAEAEPARARLGGVELLPADCPAPSGRTGVFEVAWEQPQRAVTPGQAVVLFDRARPAVVLGGGWIASRYREVC